jgi:TolC family type I secretion outer membrane protein
MIGRTIPLASSRLGAAAAAALVTAAISACAGTPHVAGAAPSPSPDVPWTPPARVERESRADTASTAVLPADLGARIQRLTLTDVIDYGLRNNPATRLAWANARAAAAAYGSERGAWLPTIDADVTGTRIQTAASQGRTAVRQSVFTPSLSLSYLLFDFGGRTGRIGAAEERAVAAAFTHNAAIQDVVLQIELSWFQYVQTRALLDAERTTVREAQTNLQAAEERRRVGVATVADVLQARTALSQAQLTLETTEGNLQTTRGALALALGLPANLPYDIDSTAAELPVSAIADSVDALIARAVEGRPDLAAARAQARAAQSHVSEVRANLLPALTLNGNTGRTYTSTIPNGSNTYTLSLGLNIPIFSGFSRQYDLREAEWLAQAARAQADAARQRVVYDVFSSYYALQTATRRVRTADDLLASATQSSEVALGRYKAGVGTVLDLLAAQTALADARAQRVQARLAWSVGLAQLTRDAGLLDPHGGSPIRLVPVPADTNTAPTR